MKKTSSFQGFILGIVILLHTQFVFGQSSVGMGTLTPNPNAVLDLVSPTNNQGLLVPRVTTAQRTSAQFTDDLSGSENGLLVFDSDLDLFFYWKDDQWTEISPSIQTGQGLVIDSIGNLVNIGDLDSLNEIQDLVLSGNQLQITQNGAATAIDLTGYLDNTDAQDLSVAGTELSISNGNTVDLGFLSDGIGTDDQDASEVAVLAQNGITSSTVQDALEEIQSEIPINISDLTNDAGFITDPTDGDPDDQNELQDLDLTGNTLTITGLVTPTEIDLSPFAGTNTDNQVIDFLNLNGTTMEISLSGDLVPNETLDLSSINTDIQDLTLTGNSLTLTNDASPVDLSGYLDNTDTQDLSLTGNSLSLTNDASPVDLSGYLDDTDDQTLSLTGTDLSISDGNTIDLSVIQDGTGTDSQDLSLTGNSLTLTNDASPVDLSGYLDNTDAQDLTLTGNSLSLTNDASPVDLSGYLDDTDDQTLSLTGTDLSISDGNTIDLSVIQDGTGTDSQDLSLTGNSLTLTNDASPVDLSGYLDNSDSQDLTLTGNSLSLTNDASPVDLSGYLDDTDDQTLSLTGMDLSISDGNTIDLSVIQDGTGTDSQDLSLTGNSLTLTNDASPVDLSGYLDNTDNQSLSLTGTDLSIAGGNTVDLSVIQDGTGTDSQDLSLTGNSLTLTNDASPVDLSGYLDNTDAQDLSLTGNSLSLTNDASPVDLSGYLDNTDAQDLTLTGNNLSLTNDASPVDLSGYLDNSDSQDLTLTGNSLTLTNDASPVDLSGYLDDTDDQTLSLTGTDLSISDGNTIDLSVIQDGTGTDSQDLSLTGNSLTLTNDASPVDLSGYLDNTDNQSLSLTGTDLSIAGGNTVDLSVIQDGTGTDSQDLSLTGNSLTLTNDASPVDLSGYLDNTDAQDLSLTGNSLSLTNDASPIDLSGYLDNTDAQDLSLTGNNLSLTNDASPVDLSGYLDNTDNQSLSLTGTDLSIAGGNTIDLSVIQDGTGTDSQDLSLTGNSLTLTNDASPVDLSGYIDNTDAQDLSLTGNSLTLTNDASPVDLSGYLDNTDAQDLTLTGNSLSLTNDASPVDLSAYLDNTDDQTATEVTVLQQNGITESNVQLALEGLHSDISTLSLGEVNTASNTGVAGVGVFRTKTGLDLEFKNINAGSNKVTVTNDGANGEIDIDVDESNLTLDNMAGGITSAQVSGLGTAATLNVGTTAFDIVQLDGDGLLPAIDGGNLTNVPLSLPVLENQNETLTVFDLRNSGTGTTASFQNSGTGTALNAEVSGTAVPSLSTMNITSTAGPGNGSIVDGLSINVTGTSLENLSQNRGLYVNVGGAQQNVAAVFEGGSVGIGTTNPVTTLDVSGTVTATSFSGDGSGLTGISGDNLGNHTLTANLRTDGRWISNDGTSSGLFLNGSGQVGAGTNTSLYNEMVVSGTDNTVSTNDGIMLDVQNLSGTIGALTGIRFKKNSVATNERYNSAIFYDGDDLTFAIKTNGTSTNVSTADAAFTIRNNKTLETSNDLILPVGMAINSGSTDMLYKSSTTTVLNTLSGNNLSLSQSGVGIININSFGTVGIGTLGNANYYAQISVPSSNTQSEYGLRIDNAYSGTGTKYGLFTNVSQDGTGTTRYGNYVTVDADGASNTYGLRLNMSGTAATNEYGVYVSGETRNYFNADLGIGTSAPSQKLDVVGNTELNGNLITPASGTLTISQTNETISTPTRRVLRIQATLTGRELHYITAGTDGQELIIINVGNIVIDVKGSGTGGAGITVTNNSLYMQYESVLGVAGMRMYPASSLHLIYDSIENKWIEIGRSNNYIALN